MRRIPAWGALAALVLLSTVLRAWAGLRVPTPWIAADEMIYGELGRSLWETGRLDILGQDAAFYSLLHPALIGLPLALVDGAAGYDLARVLQALVMSLTAVPVFLWGRRLMSEGWALVAAVLTVALPAFVYSGLLMSETVFLPVATLAAWASAATLERPTRRNQALLVGAFALALLTRLQALVLVPAFLLALGVYALLARSTEPLRRTAWAAGGLVVVALAWLVAAGLGAYGAAGEASYSAADALRFGLYHAGDLLLLVGLAPAGALVLLALDAFRRPETAAQRAYLAVTVALTAGVVGQVALFASRYVGRLAERDLLVLAPLLFLGLCIWLDRGAPRTRLSASIVAVVLAALVLFLPYGRLVHRGAIQDALMLLPLYDLGSYDLVIGLAAAAVVLLFVLLPRALPVVLVAVFVVVSVEASRFVEQESESRRAAFFAGDPEWVDRAADADVAYFYDGEPRWDAVWQHLFWNRRISRVFWLDGTKRVPGPVPQERVAPGGDGVLAEDSPPYVLASTNFTFTGEPVAEIAQQGLLHRGLVLWRGDDLALRTVRVGVQGSGDIYGPARLVAYGCTGGTFELTLVAKGSPVTIDYRAAELGAIELAPEQVANVSIPAAPVDGVCTLDLEPSGIVGSTRFEHVG